MSEETSRWLNRNTLIGYTEKRGKAWHYRASDQGDEPNHYTGPIPVEDVRRRLLGWEAVEVSMLVPAGLDGASVRQVPGRKVLLHSGNGDVLGIHKSGYRVHQFDEWLLQNVANILDADLGIGSAGLLRQAAVAWVQVEVPDTITTPEGVAFRPNLLACTSHDGSLSSTYARTVTNVVCDNTMAAGLAEQGQKVKIRHSRNSHLRITEAREALAIIHTIADDFAAEVAALCSAKVTDAHLARFLDEWAPVPAAKSQKKTMAEGKRTVLSDLWTNDPRVAPWAGTEWGVVQMVNTFTQHEKQIRGMSRPERNMLAAVEGAFDVLDADTLRLLRAVA